MDTLGIEHYKAIKEEQRHYMTQIQQLWLFKLSTLGAVIALSIFNGKAIGSFKTETIAALGLIILPLVSMLIDLKVLEFSLHIKAISNHLTEKYKEAVEIYSWEKGLWKGSRNARRRTKLTTISAIGISICILLVAFSFAYMLKHDWGWWLTGSGILLAITEIIVAVKVFSELVKGEDQT